MGELRLWYNAGATEFTMASGTEYWLKSDGTFTSAPAAASSYFQYNLGEGENHVHLQWDVFGGAGCDDFVTSVSKFRIICAAFPSARTDGDLAPGAPGLVAADMRPYGSFWLFGTQYATSPTFVALDGFNSSFTSATKIIPDDVGARFTTAFYIGAPAGLDLSGIERLFFAVSVTNTIVVSPGVFFMAARLMAKSA